MPDPTRLPHAARCAAAALIALSLTACAAEVEPKMPPLNPAPNEAYRLDVWAENPPRPMRVESMTAMYQDMQSGCLPRRPGSGALAVDDSQGQPLVVTKVSDSRYRATAHADLLLPTDLYGKGVCDWRLIGVEVIWSDEVMRYRQFAPVLPINDQSLPVAEYAVFSNQSRGLRVDEAGRPIALPIVSGTGHGPWPDGSYEDRSLPAGDMPAGAVSSRYRPLSPQTDFRVLSESRRVDDS